MFKVENISQMYEKVGYYLLNYGDKVCPRGLETKEIIAPVIHIENPRGRLVFNRDRKFNPIYALVESLMLVNKKNEVKYFSEFNKQMKNYSDDGEVLFGCYGKRVADFIPDIINKLVSDKDSRQAILTIYNNDNHYKTKDTPCTLNLNFLIRENKLNLIVYMRSNDIIWGTPYDIFMFTMLQEVIANSLGLDLGWYKHIPTSLHVYEEHYDLLHKMVSNSSCVYVNDNFLTYKDYVDLSNKYTYLVDSSENISENEQLSLHPYMQSIVNEMLSKKDLLFSRIAIDNLPEWILPYREEKWGI